jgi:hypothetical protein
MSGRSLNAIHPMPQGYFTIEQWKTRKWVAVAVLPFGLSLTAAEQALARLGKPGLFRLVQTQRIVWCERDKGGVRLRKSHASSPKGLEQIQKMFDRSAGRYPAEEARAARREAKRNRRSKPIRNESAAPAGTRLH